MVPCHRHPAFASSQLRLTIEVKHSGKSMVPCHRSPLRCMFCNLAAWSGTSGSRWFYAIGTNIVACPATRPDCLVWHIGTSMVPCHRHPHRCMSSNSAIVVRHIGKSMVPCIGLHSVACPATRPDHRGQAHRKVDGSMPSACTSLHVLQLGLTIVVRHIGKSMFSIASTSLHVRNSA